VELQAFCFQMVSRPGDGAHRASEDLLRQMAEGQIKQAPPVPDRDLKKTDDRVLEVIPDRSKKFQAPEQLRPRNQFGTPEAR